MMMRLASLLLNVLGTLMHLFPRFKVLGEQLHGRRGQTTWGKEAYQHQPCPLLRLCAAEPAVF